MKEISFLQNAIMPYAWGSKTFLQSLLNLSKPWDEPAAELWLGAHPRAPSKVKVDGEWQSLNHVIDKDPFSVLGAEVAKRFGKEMPFLLKVLAIDLPLSIQAHPDKAQAREGFNRENSRNIPLDADNRSYKDANHKPECLCAITPFEALKGFRAPKEILSLMDQVLGSFPFSELDPLRAEPNEEGLAKFFSRIMTMDAFRKDEVVKQAVTAAKRLDGNHRLFHWLLELNRVYPGDMGVLAPLFLNLVELSPGEAIYVSAGEFHAYLSGVGVEIMASSDNVLRGGLTPKYIDIKELLNIISFSAAPVQKERPSFDDAREQVYQTPADEFQLSRIFLNGQEDFLSQPHRNVEILLCMDGAGVIENLPTGQKVSVKKGGSVLIPAAVGQYAISGSITLYKGTVK